MMAERRRPTTLRSRPARARGCARLKAVAWSFFGVRRRADYAKDVDQLNPMHVVIAGIIGAALFVLLLVLLVRWVIGSGVAT